jgi:hypothetical protein
MSERSWKKGAKMVRRFAGGGVHGENSKGILVERSYYSFEAYK